MVYYRPRFKEELVRAYELLQAILSRTENKRQLRDSSWLVQCPAHDDSKPSLHLTLSGDRLLIHCFAGCSYEQVVQALRIPELDRNEAAAQVDAIYVYEDELGMPIFRKLRYPGKNFVIERLEGQRWVRGGVDKPVLYRLPEVLSANKIYIVEGEKDVETLRSRGLVATTNPHGASEKIRADYVKALQDKEIVIIPDQDESGRKHGLAWAAALWGKVKSLRLINLPIEPPEGKDVSDYLANRPTAALLALEEEEKSLVSKLFTCQRFGDLMKVTFDSLPYRLEAWPGRASGSSQNLLFSVRVRDVETDTFSGDLQDPSVRVRLERVLEERYPTELWSVVLREVALALQAGKAKALSAKELPDLPPDWRLWILHPFVLREGPSIIYGPQESLKSWLALLIVKAIIDGSPLYPCELHSSGPVLWLDWETSREIMKQRLRKLGMHDNEKFFYADLSASLDDEYSKIIRLTESANPSLVVIDSVGPAVGAELTSSFAANQFMNRIRSLGVPTFLIAHTPKHEESTVFGSTFFQNRARSLWRAQKIEDTPNLYVVSLVHKKSSYGNKSYPLKFIADFSNEEQPRFELQRLPVSENPEWDQLPLVKRIQKCLEIYGPMKKEELFELLGNPSRDVFRKELWRLRREGKVDDRRGLVTLCDHPS